MTLAIKSLDLFELICDYPYFIKRYFLWPFGIKFHIFEAIDEWKKR